MPDLGELSEAWTSREVHFIDKETIPAGSKLPSVLPGLQTFPLSRGFLDPRSKSGGREGLDWE